MHYVYAHICPVTKDIIYIGHGTGARAWMFTEPFRAKNHAEYLVKLGEDGFLPCDWVHVFLRHVSKTQACEAEQVAIKEHEPRFNKPQGPTPLITPQLLATAAEYRQLGFSYSKIAEILNVSTMTAYRALRKGESIA